LRLDIVAKFLEAAVFYEALTSCTIDYRHPERWLPTAYERRLGSLKAPVPVLGHRISH
jgi:hypothetical protein